MTVYFALSTQAAYILSEKKSISDTTEPSLKVSASFSLESLRSLDIGLGKQLIIFHWNLASVLFLFFFASLQPSLSLVFFFFFFFFFFLLKSRASSIASNFWLNLFHSGPSGQQNVLRAGLQSIFLTYRLLDLLLKHL